MLKETWKKSDNHQWSHMRRNCCYTMERNIYLDLPFLVSFPIPCEYRIQSLAGRMFENELKILSSAA